MKSKSLPLTQPTFEIADPPLPARELFSARVEKEFKKKGYISSTLVGVYLTNPDGAETRIGEYVRNYSNFYKTFYSFYLHGSYYALFSKDYSSTHLMQLPSCEVVGEEPGRGSGFCPVEYFVPKCKDRDVPFALVAGCHWGDDSSWKIRCIDLELAIDGKVQVNSPFGYIWLLGNDSLEDAITYNDFTWEEWESERCALLEVRCGTQLNIESVKLPPKD